MRLLLALLVLVVAACPGPVMPDAGVDPGANDAGGDGGVDAGASVAPSCLPALVVDADKADAGRHFLFQGQVGGQMVPRLAFDNLWRVWASAPPADVPAAIRERYGFAPALSPNDGLPMGFRAEGANVRVDCLVCHAGEVAGQTVVGAANNRLDLELFIDDLKSLARLVGFPAPNPPALEASTTSSA